MNESNEAFCEIITKNLRSFNPTNTDAILLQGHDPLPSHLAKNKELIRIIVEPRATQKLDLSEYTMGIFNGLESRDFFADAVTHDMLYVVYPTVPPSIELAPELAMEKKNNLVLGYHGNPLHLSSMVPRITRAINALAANKPVILWAMYNQDICGKWLWPENNHTKNFQVRHIPFKIENYAKYMSHVDIGIVPQLMPTRDSILLKYLLGTVKRHFNENTSDFLLRFKETTNIGRILVFAQYGIPVISDMTPSSCALLGIDELGIVAHHSRGWKRALDKLAQGKDARVAMGKRLKSHFLEHYSPDKQNSKLLDKIKELQTDK